MQNPGTTAGRLARGARWLLGSVALTGLLVGVAIPAVSIVSSQASAAKTPLAAGTPQGVRLT